MAITRRRLLLLVSFILAIVASLCVPTAANAAVQTGTACGWYDPASQELQVRISGTGFTGNVAPTSGTAVTVGNQTSTGFRNLWHNPADGLMMLDVIIPNATSSSGTWQILAVWDGDPNSEDTAARGNFGPCPGSPVIGGTTIPPANECKDVLFIGVRGSGETASQAGGYGDEVVLVASSFTANLPRRTTFRSISLDYTAAPVPTITSDVPTALLAGPGQRVREVQRAVDNGLNRYFSSIQDGIRKLSDIIGAAQRDCKDQEVVVAGYSQGALVANLVTRSAPNVAAVLLIADPARVANQEGVNLGTARGGSGVYRVVDRNLRPLVTTGQATVVQLCDSGDPICDWTTRAATLARPTGVSELNAALTRHTLYDETRVAQLREMGRLGAQAALA